MVDSDADSWYNWKQDDFNKFHREGVVNASNNACLTSISHLNCLTSDDSQKRNFQNTGLILNTAAPTSSRSTDIRFINPAIYAETLNNEDEEREIQIRVKVSSTDDRPREGNCGDFTGKSDTVTTLSIKNDLGTSFVDHAGDQVSAQETYRCYSLNSPTTSLESGLPRSKFVTSCRPSSRVERRCKITDRGVDDDEVCFNRRTDSEVQRYTFNGHRVVQVSTSSSSSITISEDRMTKNYFLKRIPYNEWVRKKQEAARQKKEEEDQAERKKQMEAERLARKKEEKESQERDNFLKWSEKKKREEEQKKAVIDKELVEFQKQLKDIEDKAAMAKSLYLRQWTRKKKEEEKARQKIEEMKRKQHDEEKKKRLEESTKAYENWRKNAKNRPKPATQGLLPHQKAKPAYVNPTPWQTVGDDAEDHEENLSNARKTQSQPKISGKRSTTHYQ